MATGKAQARMSRRFAFAWGMMAWGVAHSCWYSCWSGGCITVVRCQMSDIMSFNVRYTLHHCQKSLSRWIFKKKAKKKKKKKKKRGRRPQWNLYLTWLELQLLRPRHQRQKWFRKNLNPRQAVYVCVADECCDVHVRVGVCVCVCVCRVSVSCVMCYVTWDVRCRCEMWDVSDWYACPAWHDWRLIDNMLWIYLVWIWTI